MCARERECVVYKRDGGSTLHVGTETIQRGHAGKWGGGGGGGDMAIIKVHN